MKLLILLLSLFIGVQSQTLQDLNWEIQTLENDIIDLKEDLKNISDLIEEKKIAVGLTENAIFLIRNETANFENRINYVTQQLTSCQPTKSACLEQDEKVRPIRDQHNGVKQEKEKHRSELNGLKDKEKYLSSEIEDINRKTNESQNNLKLLEPELQELRLKLSKCAEESKSPKVTNQTTVKKETDGGGFLNKIVTSTLDKVQQFKKGVANVLRSKINFMKLKIPE